MSPEGTRRKRLATLLRQEISRILLERSKDPRLGLVTITDVEISPDLRHARVYVSTHGGANESARKVAVLTGAASFIRGELGRSIEVRYVPELRFVVDESVDRAARVNALLHKLAEHTLEDPDEHNGSEEST